MTWFLFHTVFHRSLLAWLRNVRYDSCLILNGEHEGGHAMPVVRKLAPEEVAALEQRGEKENGPRQLVEAQYDELLQKFQAGDYVVADLEPEEHKLTVRARFRRAAQRRGLTPQFQRTADNIVRFKLVEAGEQREGGG